MPRQNGKNGALEIRELFGMVGRGEKILHTAHQVKTAQKHFRRLKHFFGKKKDDPGAKFPELNALVDEIRNVNGQEAIFLTNGGSVEIVARSTGSGRGFTVDVIVCDEAQDMSDEDQEALISTSSASPLGNPQWIYTGTPPGPKVNGEVFTRIRNSALAARPKRICWHEWSAPQGVDLDDRTMWEMVNPGLVTGRLLAEVVEGERASFSDAGFARERLGMWESSIQSGVIPMPLFEKCGDPESVPSSRLALGIEVGPEMQWASVVLAGQRADERWHFEIDEDQFTKGRGADWVEGHIKALLEANPQVRDVAVDVASPIQGLLEQHNGKWRFRETKIPVKAITVQGLGATTAKFINRIAMGDLRYIPVPQLTTAATIAGKRNLGDTGMWVFSRKAAESDITSIQAAVLALWAAESTPIRRDPSEGGRRGGGRTGGGRSSGRRRVPVRG